MDTSKQLKEHLQHLQEPFSLQSYLVERSYMFNNFSSDGSNIPHLYSAKNLKWSIKYDLHKIRKRLLHASGILRSLLYKFIPTEEHNILQATQQTDSLNNDVQDKVFPFQTLTLPKLRRSEVDTGTKPYWISRGSEWKEPLPNAVCDLKSSEGQVTPVVPILSQKLVRKLLLNSNILKSRGAKKDKLKTASLCGRYGRKQLRFEFHEGKSVSSKAVSESEDLLEKQYRQVKKISQVLYAESCVVSEEWKSFQIVDWEIYIQIGDSITDDIVSEIIDLF